MWLFLVVFDFGSNSLDVVVFVVVVLCSLVFLLACGVNSLDLLFACCLFCRFHFVCVV